MQKIPAAKIDLAVFNFINGFARKSKTLDFLAVFCAEYLGYFLVAALAAIALISADWRIIGIPVLAGLASRFIIDEAVYFFYKRKRPVEVLPITALIKKPHYPAFPSGHASFFFALSLALFLFSVPLAIAFTVATCCIVFARIFCGVHWPTDILAGLGAGLLIFGLLQQLI